MSVTLMYPGSCLPLTQRIDYRLLRKLALSCGSSLALITKSLTSLALFVLHLVLVSSLYRNPLLATSSWYYPPHFNTNGYLVYYGANPACTIPTRPPSNDSWCMQPPNHPGAHIPKPPTTQSDDPMEEEEEMGAEFMSLSLPVGSFAEDSPPRKTDDCKPKESPPPQSSGYPPMPYGYPPPPYYSSTASKSPRRSSYPGMYYGAPKATRRGSAPPPPPYPYPPPMGYRYYPPPFPPADAWTSPQALEDTKDGFPSPARPSSPSLDKTTPEKVKLSRSPFRSPPLSQTKVCLRPMILVVLKHH